MATALADATTLGPQQAESQTAPCLRIVKGGFHSARNAADEQEDTAPPEALVRLLQSFDARLEELDKDAVDEGDIPMDSVARQVLLHFAVVIKLNSPECPDPSIFLREDGTGVLAYDNDQSRRRISFEFAPPSGRPHCIRIESNRTVPIDSPCTLLDLMKWLVA